MPFRTAAVCGLLCEACSVFIATQEDPERLKALSARLGLPEEEVRCSGCRSEKRFGPCADCRFSPCAGGKNISFCSECDSFPCGDLVEFQGAMPHRLDLWEDLETAKNLEIEEWIREVRQKYSCSQCGTVNSAYDISCRKCGKTPASDFTERHGSAIREFFAKRG